MSVYLHVTDDTFDVYIFARHEMFFLRVIVLFMRWYCLLLLVCFITMICFPFSARNEMLLLLFVFFARIPRRQGLQRLL